ncbi:MAG: ATP-binding cassette domain-containing protein, partial [Armatimonadota bacterium]|nr:ATP-binding cassette domain-containing protein [Armatimonadota bacterium]
MDGLRVEVRTDREAGAADVVEAPAVEIERLSVWYGASPALREVTMTIPRNRITAFIGPSGCGKTTLLRCLNRLNDLLDNVRIAGAVRIGGVDIYDPRVEVTELRR